MKKQLQALNQLENKTMKAKEKKSQLLNPGRLKKDALYALFH